jgi:hypothetical protein
VIVRPVHDDVLDQNVQLQQRVPTSQSARVFVFPGKLSPAHIGRVRAVARHVTLVGAMVRGADKKRDFEQQMPDLPVWAKDELDDVRWPAAAGPLHARYDEIVRALLSDPRTLYLGERTHRRRGLSSAFNATVRIESACWNALALLGTLQPDRVVFQATPHHIRTWVVGRCAELVGIPVTFTAPTALPWVTKVVVGIDGQRTLAREADGNPAPSERVLEFLKRMRGDHRRAMPLVDRKRLERYRGRYWSTLTEVSEVSRHHPAKAPVIIVDALRKAYCLRLYQRLAVPPVEGPPLVALLLHYQPERTTLPEGGWYSHQWLIVRTLAYAAGQVGMRVLVKEHPSVFRLPWNAGFRNADFYNAIAALPNVSLVPLDTDTFDLIDGAAAVATVTGTAMVEAVCRNTPVLSFGLRNESELSGVQRVGSVRDVIATLDRVLHGRCVIDGDAIAAYMARLEATGYEKDPEINTSVDAYCAAVMCPIHDS